MFHDIVAQGSLASSGFQGADADLYKMSLDRFEAVLQVIAVNSADLTPGSGLSAITFDDGGIGAVTAADALGRRGWQGHFFIPTAFIGGTGFVTPAHLSALRLAGHVIGSHSHTHPIPITSLGDAALRDEWARSTDILADMLGEPIITASVPGGFFDSRVAAAAASAGIRDLFTSEPRRGSWQCEGVTIHGRFCVRRASTSRRVRSLVRGERIALLGERLYWFSKKVLKDAGVDAWLSFRRRMLAHPRSAGRA